MGFGCSLQDVSKNVREMVSLHPLPSPEQKVEKQAKVTARRQLMHLIWCLKQFSLALCKQHYYETLLPSYCPQADLLGSAFTFNVYFTCDYLRRLNE